MKLCHPERILEKAFGRLKLLLTLASIGLLAGLTLRPLPISRYGSSERNRTVAVHAMIKSALEQYHEKHNGYPTPTNPDATIQISGKDMRVGGARMLYQVLTGDGDNEIKSASATGSSSDGRINKKEVGNAINANMPKSMVVRDAGGCYLVDGWGRPFQFIVGGSPQALNATYDLWSFGDDDSKASFFYDAERRRNAEATARWIKNW